MTGPEILAVFSQFVAAVGYAIVFASVVTGFVLIVFLTIGQVAHR